MAYEEQYIIDLCAGAKKASYALAALPTSVKDSLLEQIAVKLEGNIEFLLKENEKDLAAADENGLPKTMLDRLRLTEARINGIASSLRELILLADPIGSGGCIVRPNGLKISHVRAPLGCVAIIYEARPNVTVDAAALCLKTGNAVILRGGKEAIFSNKALVSLMRDVLRENGIDENSISLVDRTEREYANRLMTLREYVDVLIPRGGAGLIKSVVEAARVPVIETGAGNCHMYIEKDADMEMALTLSVSAKISRPSVCNSLEKLLVHEDIAKDFLPLFAAKAKAENVEIRGCEKVCTILPDAVPMTEDDLWREYNDYIIGVKVVKDIDEAVSHINFYSTHHSEAIVTTSLASADHFQKRIDSAAVYVNASTRFTDGNVFGLGAEIGISTQKLHARGPMGMYALTTDKYLINGSGQIR